jgi:S1-C subfamily serine protease
VTAARHGGFRLAALAPGCFFERIGLRVNDIVLRVDGRPLASVEDASAAYAWLRVTDRFSVDIIRDGRPLTLRYVITPGQQASR